MTDDWARSIENRLNVLETRNAVEEVHRINVESRLTSIEDTLKWLVRLIIGAFVLAVLAYALKGGFVGV
jgi:hypothetical protein